MIKTTVIIPNYNGAAFLKTCLDSVFDSDTPLAVVVVDNGSTDSSRDVARMYGARVRLLSFPQNRGFSAAVNAGIRAADTPFVFLLNNDTRIKADCIGRLERVLERDKGLFSVGAKMLSMYEPDKVDNAGDLYCALGWARALGKGKPSARYRRPMPVFSCCAGAALYRRAYLERTGLFDEAHFAYLEDVDIGYRARLAGWRNRIEPEAVVYHVGSATSGSRYNPFKIACSARNNVYLLYKNMPLGQILLNLPLLTVGFVTKQMFFAAKGYGKIYARGLWEGLSLCRTREARARKIPFRFANIKYYVQIQLELWRNVFYCH